MIGAGAAVKADLIAKSISVSGAVTGNVTATEKVVLQPSASVDGDIITPRLSMADGAVVKGKVEARGGRQPAS
jgi:cytoskeletal protein CcmA (bactofilin family)